MCGYIVYQEKVPVHQHLGSFRKKREGFSLDPLLGRRFGMLVLCKILYTCNWCQWINCKSMILNHFFHLKKTQILVWFDFYKVIKMLTIFILSFSSFSLTFSLLSLFFLSPPWFPDDLHKIKMFLKKFKNWRDVHPLEYILIQK